jgi:hypothetical protein
MSSAILYIGIVAIWAFVLVPRWLRRDHGQSDAPDGTGTGSEEGPASGYRHEPDRAEADERHRREPAQPSRSGSGELPPQRVVVSAEMPSPSRSRVLQARRRLLTMLLTLTGGAVACFLLKLTPWWAVVPPAGMLGLFVLLLRAATLADVEQARRRSAQAAQIRAAHQQAGAPARARVTAVESAGATGAPEPSAEVIDISARVSDQLYDQYADATIRAVGD